MDDDADTTEEMAELADKLWDAYNSQSVSAVESDIAAVRPFSASRLIPYRYTRTYCTLVVPPPLGLTTLWTVNHPEGWVPYITMLYLNKQSVCIISTSVSPYCELPQYSLLKQSAI